MTDIADQENDDELMRQLGLTAKGFLLSRMEGRVFLRLTGIVEYNGTHYPYDLVPAQGVLAKPSKWRKLDSEARAALIRERSTDRALRELAEVAAVVRLVAEAVFRGWGAHHGFGDWQTEPAKSSGTEARKRQG